MSPVVTKDEQAVHLWNCECNFFASVLRDQFGIRDSYDFPPTEAFRFLVEP